MAQHLLVTTTLLLLCLQPQISMACQKKPEPEPEPEPQVGHEFRVCPGKTDLITGFSGLSEMAYSDPECAEAFPNDLKTQSFVEDWWNKLDHGTKWANCPPGYFLQGFYFTKHQYGLYAIERGVCAKSSDYPSNYGHCYRQDTSRATRCGKGYYLAGIYRGDCTGWGCMKQLRCCEMTSSKFVVDSMDTAKELVMARTQNALSHLASKLGFDNAAGCNAYDIGGNLKKESSNWVARQCEGWNGLVIGYSQWKLSLSNIQYSEPKTTELKAHAIDSGVLVNDHPTAIFETISRQDKIIQSLRHTRMSAWKHTSGVDIKMGFRLPDFLGSFYSEVNILSSHETSQQTVKETGNSRETTFDVRREKEIPPYSSVEWTAKLFRKRTTQSYRATVRIQCSADFRSSLREGGWRGSADTNFHRDFTGQSKSYMDYRFGSATQPFYVALKQQSEQWSDPWLWGELYTKHPGVQNTINYLTNPKEYEFTIEGKFDNVQGFRTDVIFNKYSDLPRPSSYDDYQYLQDPGFDKPVGKGHNKTIVAQQDKGDPESEFDPEMTIFIRVKINGTEV